MEDTAAEATIKARLEAVSKRNPGAVDVFFRLLDHLGALALIDFEMLENMNVLGSDLYMLFVYCCERDIAKVHESIMLQTAIEQLREIPGSTFWQPPEEPEP